MGLWKLLNTFLGGDPDSTKGVQIQNDVFFVFRCF